MIDRFTDSEVKIVYDGVYFEPGVVGPIARWFLAHHYSKETPEKWIMSWCNTSVPAGNLIYVQLPDGSFRLGREVLLQELTLLNERVAIKRAKSLDRENLNSEKVPSQLGASTLSTLGQTSSNAKT